MHSDELTLPWLARLREELPGLALFDVHTHIGTSDPDGFSCEPEELLDALAVADARAVVFPMHEPQGYPPANDAVLATAAASGGRLVAFCRLDPADEPLREAERCIGAGAAGIKLHPRTERFALDHPALADVFALADERRLPVIVHAGRGIPALGRHAVDLCERFTGMRLILAHAGICDLAWIWRTAAEHPNLFFDTAWWSASDLLALFALVRPGQVLLGSDAPYGTPTLFASLALRCARQAGLDDDQVRAVAGGQLERLLAREAALDLGDAPGPAALRADPLLDRAYTFVASAIGQMTLGVSPDELLELATLACQVGDDAPQAAVCRWITFLLEERGRYRSPGDDGWPARFAPGLHLAVLAGGLARTPDVPLPPAPAAGRVSRRMEGADEKASFGPAGPGSAP